MEEEIKYRDIIDLIYRGEEKILDNKIKQANQKVKDKIKDIDLEKILKETSQPQQFENIIETIQENYSVKIAEYNKEFYKQGFIDGVNLLLNCFKS